MHFRALLALKAGSVSLRLHFWIWGEGKSMSGVPEDEEKGAWGSQGGLYKGFSSQGGGKDKYLYSSTFLSLNHVKGFFL